MLSIDGRQKRNGDQGADPNQLVKVTDSLATTNLPAGESFTTVRTARFGEVLRGVSFTPGTDVARRDADDRWIIRLPFRKRGRHDDDRQDADGSSALHGDITDKGRRAVLLRCDGCWPAGAEQSLRQPVARSSTSAIDHGEIAENRSPRSPACLPSSPAARGFPRTACAVRV